MYRVNGRLPGDHPSVWTRRCTSSCRTEDEDIKELAAEMGMTFEKLKDEVCISLHEFNPMMGHRGCRLDVHLSGDRRDADRALSSRQLSNVSAEDRPA